MRHRIGLSAFALAVVLASLLAGPTLAGVRDRTSFRVDLIEHACDAGYRVEIEVSGHDRLLDPRPAQPEFFRFQQWFEVRTIVTNETTGASFTERVDVGLREHSITRLDPSAFLYRYRTTEEGTYQVRDSRGAVVYVEHGRVVTEYVFDAVGDGSYGAPGGTLIEATEIVSTWDPTFDFCVLADELIG